MRTFAPSLALLLLVSGVAVNTQSRPCLAQAKTRRMTAEAVRAKGLTLQKTVDADLDGDGRRELLGLAKGPEGMQVILIGEDSEGAVVTQVQPPIPGKELLKAEAKHLVGPPRAQQLLVEMLDETPDEKVKHLRVYGPDGNGLSVRVKEAFASKIERARHAEDRPEWETNPNVINYGDPRAGWSFEDIQEDGTLEILVRRNSGAKLVSVKSADGTPIKLVIGVRETVYAWDAATAQFRKGEERLNDFLPAYAVAGVAASSAWVDPAILKELKARALSEAVQAAASTNGASTRNKELTDDVAVDLVPFMKAAADGNASTAWVEGDAKGEGKGEWVELTLEEEGAVHLVRLVLGCAESKQSMKDHNVPERFSIQLDSGSARTVNLRSPGVFESGIVAFTDDLVKLPERPWVKTALVFLDGKTEAKKVRVVLEKATKQGRGNRTCISEISVH